MAEFTTTIKENYRPVSDNEARRSVLVEGIPLLDQDLTETSVIQVFSTYGDISKLLLQTHGDGTTQRAVVVFGDEEGAKTALQVNGRDILGKPVTVSLAASLLQEQEVSNPTPQGGTEPSQPARRFTSAELVGNWLAQGILLGKKGVAHIQEFDEKIGVSSAATSFFVQIKTSARGLDETHHISDTLSQAARNAGARAQEIDTKLGVSQKTSQAVQRVTKLAKDNSERAMQNPTVANSVHQAGSVINRIVKDVGDWGQQALENTRSRTAEGASQTTSAGAGAEAGGGVGTGSGL